MFQMNTFNSAEQLVESFPSSVIPAHNLIAQPSSTTPGESIAVEQVSENLSSLAQPASTVSQGSLPADGQQQPDDNPSM